MSIRNFVSVAPLLAGASTAMTDARAQPQKCRHDHPPGDESRLFRNGELIMKKMPSVLFLIGGLCAAPLVSPEPASTVRAQSANLKTVKLTVSGMHCEGCVNRVTRFLKKERGVTACTVNLETGVAEVTFNPAQATEKRLVAAVKKAGYKATVQS